MRDAYAKLEKLDTSPKTVALVTKEVLKCFADPLNAGELIKEKRFGFNRGTRKARLGRFRIFYALESTNGGKATAKLLEIQRRKDAYTKAAVASR